LNDLKQGEGKLTFSDGRMIKTTWDNGQMHGEGTITDAKGKTTETTFYKDLEVKKEVASKDFYNYFYINLIFCLLTSVCLSL
jgi:hypothetical protein